MLVWTYYFPRTVWQNLRLSPRKQYLLFFIIWGYLYVAAHFLRCSIYSNYDKNFQDLDGIIQDITIYFFCNYLYYTVPSAVISNAILPCAYDNSGGSKNIETATVLVMKIKYHMMCGKACERGLALIIVSSLCRINSESFHGFCHFHLNCNSH